jgi:hypothetical protein
VAGVLGARLVTIFVAIAASRNCSTVIASFSFR